MGGIQRVRPLFSLVIPSFNPGRSQLESTLNSVADFIRARPEAWEVVFVSDGSGDGSAEWLAKAIRDRSETVRLVAYAQNRGKGFAVRGGLLAARGQYRIFTDVDLAYGFEDILRVAETLRRGHPVAIASRDHPMSRVEYPPRLRPYVMRRRVQSRIFGWITRRLLPIFERDTQAGLKGLAARAVEDLIPRVGCDGFGFDCELLLACHLLGYPVTEVPVRVRYDSAASTTGVAGMGRMIGELLAIRARWRTTPLPAESQGMRAA